MKDGLTKKQKNALTVSFMEAIKQAIPKNEDGSYNFTGLCWFCIDNMKCANNNVLVCPRTTNSLKG